MNDWTCVTEKKIFVLNQVIAYQNPAAIISFLADDFWLQWVFSDNPAFVNLPNIISLGWTWLVQE